MNHSFVSKIAFRSAFLYYMLGLAFLGILMTPVAFVQADHTSCGNSHDAWGNYTQGSYNNYYQAGYYGQGTYYSQSTYYVQSTYYGQPAYYLQGGYYPAVSQAWIRVAPEVVRYGESATVTWSGGNASACTVSGGGINSTSITGSASVTAATGEAVLTIECSLGPNISRGSTTLKVVPNLIESRNDNIFEFVRAQFSSLIAMASR